MYETLELYVVCRRLIGWSAAAGGVRCEAVPWLTWKPLRAALPFAEEPAAVLQLTRESGDPVWHRALAQACADAGDGLVLSVLPVTAPPRFEIEHDGRGAALASWEETLDAARAYQDAAQRAAQAEEARRAEARAAWERDREADRQRADRFKK